MKNYDEQFDNISKKIHNNINISCSQLELYMDVLFHIYEKGTTILKDEHKFYKKFFIGDTSLINNLNNTCKFRHKESVSFKFDDGWYWEYDEYDRITFSFILPNCNDGFWCYSFYDKPKNPDRVNVTPYQVIHQSWGYYNL